MTYNNNIEKIRLSGTNYIQLTTTYLSPLSLSPVHMGQHCCLQHVAPCVLSKKLQATCCFMLLGLERLSIPSNMLPDHNKGFPGD